LDENLKKRGMKKQEQDEDLKKLIHLLSSASNLEKELDKELKRIKNPADSKISNLRKKFFFFF
jgi:hypothetical protein